MTKHFPMSTWRLAAAAVALSLLPAAALAKLEKVAESGGERYAGDWYGAAETAERMTVSLENGLLAISGSDSRASYELRCILKEEGLLAECRGHGVDKDGTGFIMESVLAADRSDSLEEVWKVMYSTRTVANKSVWGRQPPDPRPTR